MSENFFKQSLLKLNNLIPSESVLKQYGKTLNNIQTSVWNGLLGNEKVQDVLTGNTANEIRETMRKSYNIGQIIQEINPNITGRKLDISTDNFNFNDKFKGFEA